MNALGIRHRRSANQESRHCRARMFISMPVDLTIAMKWWIRRPPLGRRRKQRHIQAQWRCGLLPKRLSHQFVADVPGAKTSADLNGRTGLRGRGLKGLDDGKPPRGFVMQVMDEGQALCRRLGLNSRLAAQGNQRVLLGLRLTTKRLVAVTCRRDQ